MDLASLKYGVLRPIEARLGRIRTTDPNAPRTIDLDIALAGEETVEDPERGIFVPDPDIARYAHLAFPLRDLDPNLRIPGGRGTLADVAAALERAGLTVREDLDLAGHLLRAERSPC